MEPISVTVAAIMAALAARASDRAVDATVQGGEGVLRRIASRVRERFAAADDEDAMGALELVERVPDSKMLVEQLAAAVNRYAVGDPVFASELADLVGEARANGVDVNSITQIALGDQAVQIAGVTSSTITITRTASPPAEPTR